MGNEQNICLFLDIFYEFKSDALAKSVPENQKLEISKEQLEFLIERLFDAG